MAAEPMTDQSVFEGLFSRALKPERDFLAELRAAGYDPARPERRYPTRVWKACVEVACRRVHPELPEGEAMNLLGRRFIDGFFETIIGKVVLVALPFLSADSLVRRIPKFLSMTATGIEVMVEQDNPQQWRIIYRDQYPLPDFVAGTMQASLHRSKLKTVEVGARRPDGFELIFRV